MSLDRLDSVSHLFLVMLNNPQVGSDNHTGRYISREGSGQKRRFRAPEISFLFHDLYIEAAQDRNNGRDANLRRSING
jgi:hypothetical protein